MVVRVVEPAMERVPEIVMVAIVYQSLNPSQCPHKQVHMKYVSPAYTGNGTKRCTHGHQTLPLYFFARRVWLARLVTTMA